MRIKTLYHRLLQRSPEVQIDVPGMADKIRLRVHSSSEHVSKKLMDVNQWEPTETKCVRALLRKPSFIIDVGANLGYYTVLFSRLLNNKGAVIALEPDKANFELLRQNIKLNALEKNVELINSAASNFRGKAYMKRSLSNFGDHRLTFQPSDGADVVSTVSLDSLISKRNQKPDFVKIDCQGSEVSVLTGLLRSFSSSILRPKALVAEVWPYGLDQAGNTIDDLMNLLPLDTYRMWDIGRWKGRPTAIGANQLRSKCAAELTIGSKLFTNIVLVDQVEKEMIEAMQYHSDR